MRYVLRPLLLVLALAPSPALAAESSVTPAVAPAEPSAPAPATLRFFNRNLVTFRAPYFGSSPGERAATGSQRLREAVLKGGRGVVKMVKTNEGLSVTVDGIYVFRILAGDLDADDGQTFDQAQVVVGGRLEEAISAVRLAMRGTALVRGFGLTAAATLSLGIAVWILVRLRRWARRRIDASLACRLHLGQQERAGMMRMFRALGQITFVVVVAVLVEEWLRFVFSLFPYTQQ